MFSPQLNEAKYNLLSADINKCGGKGNAIDVAFSRAKIQIYKIKIQTKAGKSPKTRYSVTYMTFENWVFFR